MSFSAATCLTFNPTIQHSDGPFDIYLNSDYSSTPFTSVTLTQISTNCPLIFQNIPTGTINLGVKDTIKNYCITIPIQDNNICSNCNLGLSKYSASTVSVVTAGTLTGSCQSNITDYKINWYGPNNTTTFAFSSGSGSTFSYTYPHPLIGSQSVPQVEGIYIPVIENVIINGVRYSNTGGTNNILFSGNCLPTTNVLPLTCEVRTNPTQYPNSYFPYSAYSQFITLSASTNSIAPISTTFKVSASTKFLAWAFNGHEIPDRVKIRFSGSNYNGTIIDLEDWVIGGRTDVSTNSNNFTPNLYPKSAATGNNFFQKITTLTGLTVNNNDNVIINVTPTQPGTLWDLYITCLNSWNCTDCVTSQNYKLVGNQITSSVQPCNKLNVVISISGCSYPSLYDSLFYTYYGFGNSYNSYNPVYLQTNGLQTSSSYSNTLFPSTFTCYGSSCGSDILLCSLDNTPTTYEKTFLNDGRGVFGFTGSSQFITTYYNSWVTPLPSYCSGSTDPHNILYYTYINMKIPSLACTENCGDTPSGILPYITLRLHQTSTVLTGTTGSLYFMKITANTITNQTTYTTCQTGCENAVNNSLYYINNTSTGSTTNGYGLNRTFSQGVYYKTPTHITYIYVNPGYSYPNWPLSGNYISSTYQGNTYPSSGTTPTIIPSISGPVCDYNSNGVVNSNGVINYSSYNHYKYQYDVRLTNLVTVGDFDIWATPIINYVPTGSPVLAYRYSGGSVTYTNPTYVI